MEVSKQALQNIISDEERLLFAENIPAEYPALGRHTGTADALVFALSTEEVSSCSGTNENGIPVTPRGTGQSGGLDNPAVRWYHSGCIAQTCSSWTATR
ncbi:MAG: hypothetical protein ACLRVN_04000 [Butyricicoccus sp.]